MDKIQDSEFAVGSVLTKAIVRYVKVAAMIGAAFYIYQQFAAGYRSLHPTPQPAFQAQPVLPNIEPKAAPSGYWQFESKPGWQFDSPGELHVLPADAPKGPAV